STLLKLIGGILQPTSGVVRTRGRLAALLELGAGFHPDLTGRENVYLNGSFLGLTKEQTDRYFEAIVDFSGIERFIDTQVKFYSSGMYVRLAFAVAVHVDPDVLLVDEVLSVGDEPFQRKCMDRIRTFQHEGRTIVLVTHALDQVTALCDRAVVLEHGSIKAEGPPIQALRRLRDDFEATRRDDVARTKAEATAEGGSKASAAITTSAPRTVVRAVEVLAAGRCGTDVSFPPGADVTISVTVSTETPLEDWFLGIGIKDHHDQFVYSTNTRLLRIALPRLTGVGTFQFRLPTLMLGEGAYFVDSSVSLADGIQISHAKAAARIVSTTAGDSTGLVYSAAEFIIVSSNDDSQTSTRGRP
ncbi:MAG: Wzt carbohydrate-binding domain-containing protein, partial [Micrococcales bacterium]|nr:Wzt carbohydrate-binding domain-containing protein [Micrococcales bacterium]